MILARSSLPKNKLSSPALFLSLSLAGFMMVIATAQLMTIDKFIPIIQNYNLTSDSSSGTVIAALLVVGEVYSLPFLLRMRLSRLLRLMSALSLICVSGLWLFLGVWAVATHAPLIGLGIFGSLLKHGSAGLLVSFGCGLLAVGVIVIWRLRRDFSY